MTRMQDLFASERRRDERVISTLDDPATSRRLEAMFHGAPRATASPSEFPDEVTALTELISSRRVVPAEPKGLKKPGRLRRSRSGRDWLSIGAAALAVVSVVSASTLVGITVASASPASDAVNTLTANEAVLANSIERVNNSISALEQSRRTSKSNAEALGTPLAALGQITQIPAVASAEAARQTLLSQIDGVTMPESVPAYRRPAIETDSLESVGTAIDLVDVRTREAEATSAQLDELRLALEQTVRPFTDAVAALGRELPAVATTLLTENDVADETLRANVTTLAARVAEVDSTAASSAINDFVNAVTLLRADQAATETEIAEEAAAEAERRRQQQIREQQEREEEQQAPVTPSEPVTPAEPEPTPTPEETTPAAPVPEPSTPSTPDPGTGA